VVSGAGGVWKGVGISASGWSVYIGGRVSSPDGGLVRLGPVVAVAILEVLVMLVTPMIPA
jgi:hypothetical protein